MPSSTSRLEYAPVNARSATSSRPPGLRTRAASSIAWARPFDPRMLWMAMFETTTSNVSDGKGSAIMFAVSGATRCDTPSASAFLRVAATELPDWSPRLQMSTPKPCPVVNRFAAASSTAPRPHPRSRSRSSPRNRSPSRSSPHTRNFPRRVACSAVATKQSAIDPPISGGHVRDSAATTTMNVRTTPASGSFNPASQP
jgi:hypothetical protein